MKRILSLIISLVFMFFILPIQTYAEKQIEVIINGEKVVFTGSPIIENGTTLVEFRPIFEKLGLKVNWNGETRTVSGDNENIKIELKIGNKVAVVNGG